jgi:pimeloyl-ACP methyl ester carboxylesterase
VLLNFRRSGEGSPVVILHGLFGSLDNWQHISQRLCSRFSVLACDLRNHGQSPHHEEIDYAAMAGDLVETLDHENILSAHLIGHSLGGKVAMEFALEHPERVSSLIVVDIAPRRYPPLHGEIFEALLGLDPAQIQDRRQAEHALAPAIPDLAVRRFLLKNLARSESGGFRWRFALTALWRNYAGLSQALRGGRVFPGPTLFVRGADSDYIRDEDVPGIRSSFPGMTLQTIEAAGHWVHADQPARFVETVTAFLENCITGKISLPA